MKTDPVSPLRKKPAKTKAEPEYSAPSKEIPVKDLVFGEWAICPKCHAKIRVVVCKKCGGTGIVPNKGPIAFVRNPGGD